VIGQVDRAEVAADVQTVLGRTLPDDTPVTGLVDLGSGDEQVVTVPLRRLGEISVGPRTSLYLDPPPTGWVGLVATNRLLREQCPWDARQTHHSLVNHLVEEAYETVEALSALPPEAPGGEPDYGAYAEVEEELGDLLLQVVFHATLARETGAFDVEEVAEGIRRKLVDRHPHVFGDADGDLEVVRETWERRKQVEKGRSSILDGVPASLPALARATKFQQRAASVGFDWDRAEPVLDKVAEEVDELRQDLDSPARSADELGDLLFSAVNLARHLGVDPELALRRASDRFSDRFRRVERAAAAGGRAPADMTLQELDALWEAAKEAAGEPGD
jgi:tetrapyrrole methylase family protein/MazG family protein